MQPSEIETYLYTNIPLSREMQVRVVAIDDSGVRLAAPLAPNINHRRTVFGGSASALAILSAWTLVHVRMHEAGLAGKIVIQRNSMEYLHPIHGDFEAHCEAPEADAWEKFEQSVMRRGRGRITLHAQLLGDGRVAGNFRGVYVALRPAAEHSRDPDL